MSVVSIADTAFLFVNEKRRDGAVEERAGDQRVFWPSRAVEQGERR